MSTDRRLVLSRRRALLGLLAAPAIVRPGLLMPIPRRLVPTMPSMILNLDPSSPSSKLLVASLDWWPERGR